VVTLVVPEPLVPELLVPELLVPELLVPEPLVPELVVPELLVPEPLVPELLVPELLVPVVPEPDPVDELPVPLEAVFEVLATAALFALPVSTGSCPLTSLTKIRPHSVTNTTTAIATTVRRSRRTCRRRSWSLALASAFGSRASVDTPKASPGPVRGR
jgi:hypothetical protein